MTVEASYVFPFCVFAIAVTMLLGIYCYNQAVFRMTGYECILRTMEERTLDDDVVRENLTKRVKETASERAIGIDDLKVSVKMTASKISVSVEGVQTVFEVPVKAEAVYERVYPELTLRITRGSFAKDYGGKTETGTE